MIIFAIVLLIAWAIIYHMQQKTAENKAEDSQDDDVSSESSFAGFMCEIEGEVSESFLQEFQQ